MYSLSYKTEFRQGFQAPHFCDATPQNFKTVYNDFVHCYPYRCRRIDDQRRDGIGTGELIAYFIFDNVTLGGRNSTCDVYADGVPFAEFKAGPYSRSSNTFTDIKLGQDQSRSSEYAVKELGNVKASERNTVDSKVVANWCDQLYGEIQSKPYAFVDTSDLSMRFFGPLTKEMVDLYRVQRNQPRARVLLPKVNYG